jgi:hypothetical protein
MGQDGTGTGRRWSGKGSATVVVVEKGLGTSQQTGKVTRRFWSQWGVQGGPPSCGYLEQGQRRAAVLLCVARAAAGTHGKARFAGVI